MTILAYVTNLLSNIHRKKLPQIFDQKSIAT